MGKVEQLQNGMKFTIDGDGLDTTYHIRRVNNDIGMCAVTWGDGENNNISYSTRTVLEFLNFGYWHLLD